MTIYLSTLIFRFLDVLSSNLELSSDRCRTFHHKEHEEHEVFEVVCRWERIAFSLARSLRSVTSPVWPVGHPHRKVL
jgi:hypothetical protein